MFCLRNAFVVMHCAVALMVHNHTEERHHPLPYMAENIELLCPLSNTCNNKHNIDPWTCCKGCSCSDDCGLGHNCCYPELDTHNTEDQTYQQCIEPVINNPFQKIEDRIPIDFAYNMIVDVFPGQTCGNSVNVNGTRCGDDETATPYGSLYPVFSSETRRVYKNIKCARCHGLDEDSVTTWDLIIVCEKAAPNTQLDLEAYNLAFENGELPPTCNYRFECPGSIIDTVQPNKCFKHATNTCLAHNDFVIPENIDMTHDQVRAACHSKLHAPYTRGGIFANVFCYICNGGLSVSWTTVILFCPWFQSQLMSGSVLNLQPTKVIGKIKSNEAINRKIRLVCPGTKQAQEDCRTLHCPSGRVMAISGSCQFPNYTLIGEHLCVVVKLFPSEKIAIKSLENTNGKTRFVGADFHSYKRLKHMGNLFYEVDDDLVSVKNFVHYGMYLDSQDINISRIVLDLESNMKKMWTVDLGDGKIQLEPKFSEYFGLISYNDTSNSFYTLNETAIMSIIPSSSKNITLPVLKQWYYRGYCEGSEVKINKLYYCDQIALKPNEYVLHEEALILYYKNNQRIFFDNEFALVYDMSLDVYVPRICFSDSGFILFDQPSVNSARSEKKSPQIFHWIIFVFAMHWLLIVVLKPELHISS